MEKNGAGSRILFSKCRLRDCREVFRLFKSSFPSIAENEISHLIRKYRRQIRIGRVDTEAVAFTINLPGKRSRLAWLEQIGVAPAEQGKGLGRRALSDFEEQCALQGYDRIELNVKIKDVNAVLLYRSSGYKQLDRPGEDLSFFKDLKPTGSLIPQKLPGLIETVLTKLLFKVLVR